LTSTEKCFDNQLEHGDTPLNHCTTLLTPELPEVRITKTPPYTANVQAFQKDLRKTEKSSKIFLNQ